MIFETFMQWYFWVFLVYMVLTALINLANASLRINVEKNEASHKMRVEGVTMPSLSRIISWVIWFMSMSYIQ